MSRPQSRDEGVIPSRRGSLLVTGIAIELALLVVVRIGDLGSNLPAFGAAYWAACLAYFAAIWAVERHGDLRRKDLWMALALAVLFRVTLLPTAPSLSDDIYRYVWDGRVQLHGVNPYLHAPDAPQLEWLRDPYHDTINHPEIPTIYPPFMQWVFAGAAAFTPGIVGMKLTMVVFDLAVLAGIIGTLSVLGLPSARVIRYAWNPLVLVEVAGNGHNDVVGVALLLLAACLASPAQIIPGRRRLSTLLLALSILAKTLPVAMLPLWWRRLGKTVVAVPVLVGIGYLPYAGAGWGVTSGLGAFARRWSANEWLFAVVHRLVTLADPTPILKRSVAALQSTFGDGRIIQLMYRSVYPDELARMVVAVLYLCFVAWLLWRRVPWPRSVYLGIGAVLLLFPTLHPWYLLWVLPFAAIAGGLGWMVLSVASPLAYMAAAAATPPSLSTVTLVYAPLLLWPLMVYWKRLRRAGPGGGRENPTRR